MNIANVNQNIVFYGLKKGRNPVEQGDIQKKNCDVENSCHRCTLFDKGSSRKVALALAALAGLGVGASQVKNVVQPVYDVTMPESSYVVRLDVEKTPFEIGNDIQSITKPIENKEETQLETELNRETAEETVEKTSNEVKIEEFATENVKEVSKETQSDESVTELETEINQEETTVEITPQQRLENEYGIKIDGVIDDHNLGWHGDCYLLATLESLNTTENGRKLIQDNITINEDSLSVHFPGINYTSEISFKDLKEAKEHGRYSVGDDDILLFEVAIQDAYIKIKDGKIEAPVEIIGSINDSKDVLYAGYMQDVMFLYTGRLSWETVNPSLEGYDVNFEGRYDFDLNGAFDYKMNNHDNVAMTLSMESRSTPGAYHAYGVLAVDKNNVTIMDPIGSKPVTYSRQEILDRVVDIEYCSIVTDGGDSPLGFNV